MYFIQVDESGKVPNNRNTNRRRKVEANFIMNLVLGGRAVSIGVNVVISVGNAAGCGGGRGLSENCDLEAGDTP